MGDQPLYDLSVTFEPNNTPSASVTAHRKVGFRYFALVTGNDTDPAYVTKAASEQGTDSHGMYFRINGAAFWSKGGISWGRKRRFWARDAWKKSWSSYIFFLHGLHGVDGVGLTVHLLSIPSGELT